MFSPAAGREEHGKQISLVSVGSAPSVSATLVCPTHGMSAFPVYTAQVLGALPGTVSGQSWVECTSQVKAAQVQVLGYSTKAQTWLGLRFVPFPGPRSSGDQVLGECTLPTWAVHLITSPVPAARFPGCAAGVPSQVCHVSLLGS